MRSPEICPPHNIDRNVTYVFFAYEHGINTTWWRSRCNANERTPWRFRSAFPIQVYFGPKNSGCSCCFFYCCSLLLDKVSYKSMNFSVPLCCFLWPVRTLHSAPTVFFAVRHAPLFLAQNYVDFMSYMRWSYCTLLLKDKLLGFSEGYVRSSAFLFSLVFGANFTWN